MNDREHIVTVRAAFDKRDANPSKNYGIHGAELRFLVKGPEGAEPFDGATVHLPPPELILAHHSAKFADPSEWPEDLRVREFPITPGVKG